jgi:chromosome segregation ATPase
MKRVLSIAAIVLFGGGLAWAQVVPESLGEIARRLRAEKAKDKAEQAKVLTNEDVARLGGDVNVVGSAPTSASAAEGAEGEGGEAAAEAGAAKEAKCDEACWKGKFSEARSKIRAARSELDVLQREYNLARTQYYQDPNQAVREQYSNNPAGGGELQNLQNRMDEKRAEIDKFTQQLSALEDELRKSGGEPGWAREP